MPESPASSQRPFDFADLGRPMPKSVRTVPPVPQADASGQLEELSGDDILESDDIDALEAAAAGFSSFEVEAAEPYVAGAAPAVVPAPEPSGFEVGEVGAFDEVQVEGIATRATEPAPEPARIGAVAVIAPAVKVAEAAPVVFESAPITARVPNQSPSTLVGMPAAPVTSPLTLEDREESVIISGPAPQVAKAAPAAPATAEKTLEIRGNDMAKVAAAAAQLTDLADSEPQQTEVLVRSAMPPALQQKFNARPSSIAPVALDVTQRPMPVIPPMARVPAPMPMPMRAAVARPSGGLSGLAIGGIAAGAILLVSLVGIGGYAASRTLSAKTDAVEATTETTSAAGESAPSQAPATVAADPTGAASSPIDVSSLPSAPVPGAVSRGFTGKGSFAVTPPPTAPVAAPQVVASPVVAAPVVAAPAAAPVARSSGGALAAPGGNRTSSAPAGAPLPPPAAAPVVAAPVAAAPVATTGVIRVDPNLRAVVVDGSFRHANDGVVTVSCGSHKVKAGMKEAQTVTVPCGGAVSL